MIEPVVVATGSKGNCIIYDKVIIDIGVSFKKCQDHIRNCKFLFLTHEHGDHLNKTTLKKLIDHRPDILIIAPYYLEEKLYPLGLRNVHYIKPNVEYELPNLIFKAHEVTHDVLNVAYSLYFQEDHETYYKIFHATDTYSLDGIEAKDYDLYAVEYNHDEILIQKDIERKKILGQYAHEVAAVYNHQSFQRAQAWLNDQAKPESRVMKLHLSSSYFMDEDGVISKLPVEEYAGNLATIPNEEE